MVKISALTISSQRKLAKRMSDEDLLYLCQCSGEVQRDARTIESYREEEKKMCEKYGFTIR